MSQAGHPTLNTRSARVVPCQRRRRRLDDAAATAAAADAGDVLVYTCSTHTPTHLTALCPELPRVSRYQSGNTNRDFTEARDSEWQWHQLDHMQVCISLQTDNHGSTPPLSFFTGRMPFLPPNQQRQSTEGVRLHV